MKFSVLLPTRNRLELLRYAVESVLRQDYHDWEISISDNCSEENIEGYVQSLSDERVKYSRFNTFVPVTDNWNNALKFATGTYHVMLGDDDCLMPGYFTKMAQLIQEYESPDFIFTDAFLFAYPGVLSDHPSGYLRERYNEFFQNRGPFLLGIEESAEIVKKSLSLIECVRYNMQLSLISHNFVERLKNRGSFYQSIFPDFYATVVAFLKSNRTLIYQKPMVTVGISPKSFGVFHFSGEEGKGKSFLYEDSLQTALKPVKDVILPGDFSYTGWLSAMDTINKNYAQEIAKLGVRVGYKRYRRLQIIYMYKNYLGDKRVPAEVFREFKERLSLTEAIASPFLHILFSLLGMLSAGNRDRIIQGIRKFIGRPNIFKEDQDVKRYATILDVFEKNALVSSDSEHVSQ